MRGGAGSPIHNGPKLFPEIDGLDNKILAELAAIGEQFAIVIHKVKYPPGELFGMPSHQYGIYLVLDADFGGSRKIWGVKTTRLNPEGQQEIALNSMRMLLEATGALWPKTIKQETTLAEM